MEITTNTLVGKYRVEEGVKILIANTLLKVEIGADGQLTLMIDQSLGEIDSMRKNNKLAAAIACITAACISANSIAQDKIEKEEEVVEVLGSYLSSTDTAAANPVSVVTSEDVQYTGASDITDIMNTMAVSSGAENRPDTFTSFYSQGTSNVNLRGLGLSSTLVLINGKRHTYSGAKAQDGSVFVDTGSVPAIALERLEVLKEGAASAYGSDAVAGVVNFVTKDDFEGFKVEGSWQKTEEFGQRDRNLSAIGGFTIGDSANVVLAASFLRRDNLRGHEREELIQAANSSLGTAFIMSADTTVASGPWAGSYVAGENVGNPDCDAVDGVPIDRAGDPGTIDRCGFRYGRHYNIINEENRDQYYASFTQEFSNDMELSVKAFYTDYEIVDNYSVPSLPNLNFPTIAADQAANPFGVDVVILGRHNPTLDFDESRAAPRDNKTFRLEGELDGTFGNGWDWSTSLAYSTNTYEISQPEMSQARLNAALAGNGGPSGTETFDHFDFRNNSDTLLEWLKTDFKSETTTSLMVWDTVVNGELFELPAGTAQLAVGAQLRSEGYEVTPEVDAANPLQDSQIDYDANGNPLASDFTFLGTVNKVDESRSTEALFVEMELPIVDFLTVNAALRYESLDTATSTDPKLSLLFSATDSLAFRASASTSFREPSLSQINADVVNTANVVDYVLNPDGTPALDSDGNLQLESSSIFIRQTTTGNEDLDPEQATNYNLGMVWDSDSWEVRADYWRIDYEDVITIESPQGVLAEDPNGPTVVRQDPNDPTSNLAGISTDYFNAQTIDASGIDIETTYMTDLLGGGLKLNLGLSRYLEYEVPINGVKTDVAGQFNFGNFVRSLPETKGAFSAHWKNDVHSFYAKANYVSSYENNRQGDTIDSFETVDFQYRYTQEVHGDNEFIISLGILNLFDRDAPFVADGANFSYDPKHHDPRGRMFYTRASYQF
ncbi:MAG: TonB-dependent receptor [Agarilytica sp.]